MQLPIILSAASSFIAASTFSAITWLFADALLFRFEIKSFFKGLAFALLTVSFATTLLSVFVPINISLFSFWTSQLGLWLMFLAFATDEHSKLKILLVVLIVILFFLQGHLLLSAESLIVAITVLQIAYYTKHKDLILFMLGLFLITIAEFFYWLNGLKDFKNFALAGDLMYIFASVAFFYWLWSYLVIRFNLSKKLKI